MHEVCAAYAACIERAGDLAPGTILNITSGTPRRIGDILETLMRLAGVSVPIEQDQARLRPNDIARAVGNPTRAHALLGWAPARNWDVTLREVLADR